VRPRAPGIEPEIGDEEGVMSPQFPAFVTIEDG
jgi:hypothetical protein